MVVPRQIQRALKDALADFPIVVVTGARQTGKTTLVRHVLSEGYRYVSLDELDVRASARDDPRGFLADLGSRAILDEIQHLPELLPYLKAEVDRRPASGRYVLTGSQQFALMRGVSESLAGRAAILRLDPFSVEEMQGGAERVEAPFGDWFEQAVERRADATTAPFSTGTWLLRGGYPALVTRPRSKLNLWFSSYVETYLDRDVRGAIKAGNLADFERFLRLLAARTGTLLNLSALSRDIGISVPTLTAWLSMLQASGIVHLLQPLLPNLGKRQTKTPKLYFSDTGLAAYLVGLQTEEHLLNGPMSGALFETAVVNDVLRRLRTTLDASTAWFWRTNTGDEVDLVVDSGGRLFGCEIKLSATITSDHLNGLRAFQASVGAAATTSMVICTIQEPRRVAEGVRAVPWWWR